MSEESPERQARSSARRDVLRKPWKVRTLCERVYSALLSRQAADR